jgi:dihydroflavonol-4-reductase
MPASLVTGGCGFIGRHLVAALLARGEAVRVLDTGEPGGLPAGAELVRGSILDHSALARVLHGVERVYHLAAISHLWTRDRKNFDIVNRYGTEAILAAAAEMEVSRVIHCSTEAILLPKRSSAGVIDETAAPPLSDMAGPYTRSKHLAEQAAMAAARRGLPVVIVNPTVPIGPDDRNMTPPTAMLALFLEGRSPFFLDCVLNLVDVRDVATGMLLAGDRGRAGERYILGGETLRLGALLERLHAISGRSMPQRKVPPALALAAARSAEWIADHVTRREPAATAEGVRLALRSAPFDSGKARRELGYAPQPIGTALSDCVEWLAARRPKGDLIR